MAEQTKPLAGLQLWEDNYNRGDVAGIARSIRRFGFNNAPRIWKDNEVRGGNHTVLALRKIKDEGPRPDLDKQWPPENVQVNDKDWHIPWIDISHLDPLEATAFAIADNQHARNATQDDRLLFEYLNDIAVDATLMDATGYSDDAFDQLTKLVQQMEHEAASKSDETTPDATPADEAQAIWQVEPGDLYVIPSLTGTGQHRLLCGDATSHEDMARLCEQPIQGVFTSPPYAEQRKDDYESIAADAYVDWWEGVQAAVRQHLSPDGSFFLNIKPHVEDGSRSLYVFDLVLTMVRVWGWQLIDEFSWSRIGNPGQWRNRFKNGFEPVYHFALQVDCKFRPHQAATSSSGSGGATNVNTGDYYNTADVSWDYALPSNRLDILKNAEGVGHAAAFPIDLPAFFIRAYSDPGDVWLDPFMGSGSTLLAAERFKRLAYGMELKPENVAITLQRLTEAGMEPVKQ